jgi:hypothetical protein
MRREKEKPHRKGRKASAEPSNALSCSHAMLERISLLRHPRERARRHRHAREPRGHQSRVRRTAYFRVTPAYPLDFFDAVWLATLSTKDEGRSVSVGTPWTDYGTTRTAAASFRSRHRSRWAPRMA